MKRMLLIGLATVLGAYLAICVAACGMQRSLLYYPQRPPVEGSLERYGIQRAIRDGVTVDWLHLPGPAGAPTVVHFHGNAEQLFDQRGLGEALVARGVGFAAIEYPGYGNTPGKPTEASLYETAQAGLAVLGELGVTQVVLSGRSLGSGVAVELASRGYGAALILISPYTSIPDVGARIYPWLPVRLLSLDRYDSADKAPRIQLPVLIVHGSADTLIPVEMGRTLARTFPWAELLEIPGATHDDVVDAEATLDRIAAFARQGAGALPSAP